MVYTVGRVFSWRPMPYKIAHISDTHIKRYKYHYEYRIVFKQLYEMLREEKVDYIVHCGDLFHSKTDLSPEAVSMATEFIKNLADIAPLYAIAGNHDGNLKNSSRQDAITPIVNAINHPNVHYLLKAGETVINEDLALNVLSVFDEDNWVTPSDDSRINVALYHGAVSGVKTDTGWVMDHGDHDVDIFSGHDYAMLGDIHKTNQIVDVDGKVRYCGSTVQQNHGETNDKGFLVWDIEDKNNFSVKHHVLLNPRPFITIELTPKGRMPKGTKIPQGARLRLISNNNLPLDIMRKAVDVAKHRFNPESIAFLNRAAGQRGEVEIAGDFKVENLRDKGVQEELIREYLKDFEPDEDTLQRVFELNRKYNSQIEKTEKITRNVNWNINRFEWENLFNYGEDNSINFTNLNGIVGIFGKNYTGKSSVIDGLFYTIFNTTTKNERKNYNIINQNREECRGLVELQIGDNVYIIERRSEKYVKRLKGVETNEAKTLLDFYRIDPVTGEHISLNGTTRNETDENIRRKFGTIDDFLLTSMSSQLDSLAFIKEGSTRRKEILAKFLDLEIFESKFSLAKEDGAELKGILRRFGDTDFSNDIIIAETLRDEAHKKLDKDTIRLDLAKQELSTLAEKTLDLTKQIESIPTEHLDYVGLVSSHENLSDSISEKRDEIIKLRKSIASKESSLLGYTDSLSRINLEELLQTKKTLDHYKRLYDTAVQDARILDNDFKSKKNKMKLLSEVPCGDLFPKCRFISDAHSSSLSLPSLEAEILSKIEEAGLYKSKVVEINSEEILNLIDRHNELVSSISTLELEKRDEKFSIEKIFGKIKDSRQERKLVAAKIKLYNDNKENIQNIESLILSKSEIQKEISSLEKECTKLGESINLKNREIGSLEQKVTGLIESKEEIENYRKEFAAYDLFMNCMHSNGIAYDIIKKRLPVINEEISRIISNIVDFEVFFQENGNKLDVLIKHPKHEPRSIDMGSGAEKTIASIGIRLALLSVSSLPKSSIFALDEPATALDSENMEGFIRILQLIKMYYKTVILITHLESLKDSVDTEITIEKVEGFARINQ